MRWRDLLCFIAGHRPRVVRGTYFAKCRCCGVTVNVRTGVATYR